jgi:hypothetical protein
MAKLFSIPKIVYVTLFILLVFYSLASAEWAESNHFGIGSLYFTSGYFLEIPCSPYIAYYTGDCVIILDKINLKIRGGLLTHGFDSRTPVVIPDTSSGWNLFYCFDGKFGRLNIDPYGQFGENRFLTRTYENLTFSVGNPDNYEIWYFTNKILRLNTIDDSWTEFDYPENWDIDCRMINVYSALDKSSIFGIAMGNTIEDYQAFILDIKTGSSKLINAEKDFFNYINDIKAWREHPGLFIIMKYNEIYSYDSNTGKIELLIKDFGAPAIKILQDESGRYLYLIDEETSLCVLDLIEKTFDYNEISLKEGYFFSPSSFKTIYDPVNNRIIAMITNNYYENDEIIVILDLDDFSLNYFESQSGTIDKTPLFLIEDSKLFFSSTPYIYLVDLKTFQSKNSFPIMYQANSWNIIDDFNSSILLSNSAGSEFIMINPDYSRKIYNTDLVADIVGQFPDGKKALIGEPFSEYTSPETGFDYNIYREYDFADGAIQDVKLPYDADYLITDVENNQLIGVGEQYIPKNKYICNFVQFINPDCYSELWSAPNLNFSPGKFLFDEGNGILWLLFNNQDDGNRYFYKFSTKEKSLIDTFIIQGSGDSKLESIKSVVLDPGGKYLYFIEVTNSRSQRNLAVLDIDLKEIINRFTLQTEVKNKTNQDAVYPGIIPVFEKDKLFLWDHYGAWCIDTKSWEIIYGEVKNNPRAFCYSTNRYNNPDVKGTYINETNHIILLDYSKDKEGSGSDHYRCLEVNLDTGSIVKEFEKPVGTNNVCFAKDKKSILFLDSNNSRINTLHLDPGWNTPVTITPSTNYIQLGEGDNAKFAVNVKNEYDFAQNATAYIWLYAPDGTMLFFNGNGLTTGTAGIPLTLPAKCDITGDILTFTMPAGVPEGFYNFNAVFVNENGDRGPIGTWNFYVKD